MHDHATPDSSASAPSRRDFLARTTAFGAAGAILAAGDVTAETPAPAPRGKDPVRVADGEPIRIAVLGIGGMGSAHARSLMAIAEDGREQVQIVAVCDVCDLKTESNRKACEERQGITVTGTRSYEELLARDDIHAVLIAAPEHWHGQMSRDALVAGKDVYVEKPMTLRLDDALHLRRVVQANPQMVFQVGTQKMMLPKYQEAKKLIAEGAIGKPTSSQTSYCRNSDKGEWLYYAIDERWEPGVNLDWTAWCGPAGEAPWDPAVYARWRRYRRWSTGIIGDLLVHQMTPLMMALDVGWPTRVVASGGHYVDDAMENHDQVNINIEFEREHTMVVAGSTCNEVGLETLIRGHEANLYLGGRNCVLRPERLYVDDIDERTIECTDIGNDQDQLRLDWLRCIRTRERAMSDIEMATKVMVVVDLATRSMWDGGAYRFDPATMTASRT